MNMSSVQIWLWVTLNLNLSIFSAVKLGINNLPPPVCQNAPGPQCVPWARKPARKIKLIFCSYYCRTTVLPSLLNSAGGNVVFKDTWSIIWASGVNPRPSLWPFCSTRAVKIVIVSVLNGNTRSLLPSAGGSEFGWGEQVAPSFLHPTTLLHSSTVHAGSCIALWVPASRPGQSRFVSQRGGNLSGHADRVRKDIKASSVTFWDTNSCLPFTVLLGPILHQ